MEPNKKPTQGPIVSLKSKADIEQQIKNLEKKPIVVAQKGETKSIEQLIPSFRQRQQAQNQQFVQQSQQQQIPQMNLRSMNIKTKSKKADYPQQQMNIPMQQLQQMQIPQQQQMNIPMQQLQQMQIPQQQMNIPMQQQQCQQPRQDIKRKQIQQNFSNSLAQQKFQNVEFEKVINTKKVEDLKDLDQNFNYKNAFLGKEGMFKGYKLLIGQFYYQGENFQVGFLKTAGYELQRIGFEFDIVYSEDQFAEILTNYDIAWIISNTCFTGNDQKFVDAVLNFNKQKKSIMLWGDNDPYNVHVNLVLDRLFSGMYVIGNYYGGQIITAEEKAAQCRFDANHAIAYGLNNLHEGVTICHPENIHKDFKIFAYNSSNEPLVVFCDEAENHGRIIVDCGFTKLYPQFWQNAGTNQYISNCVVWLSGIVV